MGGLGVREVYQTGSIVGFWFGNAAAAPTTHSDLGDRDFFDLGDSCDRAKKLVGAGKILRARP